MKVARGHSLRSKGRACESARPTEAEGHIQVTSGPFLCRLQVWTDQEWDALPESSRPLEYVHAPGLGWVGAVSIGCMN
jgi:hypothetical protein